MALSDLFRSGGGNIQYLFHICGYPWAVCTSPALRELLDSGNYDSYRRKIFGHAWYGSPGSEEYFADDTDLCPIFATLQLPGSQRWTVDEAKGRLDGGSWSVEIEDQPLGHTWQHGGSQSFWGLEGVHRIAQPFKDGLTAWGTLISAYMEDDTTIYVTEENGDLLSTRITAGIAADTYYLLWLGQECIAVTAQSISGHDLTLTGGERGLFRTVEQHHRTEEYSDANPIITDSPLSIVDKPCWLWAFALANDDSEILMSPGCVRWGKVGTRVETKNGLTKIDCLSPLSILDNDVRAVQFHGGYLTGYVLSRPTDSDNSDSECLANRQSPHIVIREFEDQTDEYGTSYNIWLCDAGTSETFETVQDLYDRINRELAFCFTGSSDLNPDISSMNYFYHLQYSDDDPSAPFIYQSVPSGGDPVVKLALLSGPIAQYLNLGDPYTKHDTDPFIENIRRYGPSYAKYTIPDDSLVTSTAWMACINNDDTLNQYVPITNEYPTEYPGKPLPGKRIMWVAQYMYQWEWSAWNILEDEGEKNVYDFNMADNKLYFQRNADISAMNDGDIYMIGHPGDRYGQFTVVSSEPDEAPPYVNTGSELHRVPGYKKPYFVGRELCYIPALETDDDDIYDEDDNLIERTDADTWLVSGAKQIRAETAYDIFNTLLGGSTVDIPESAKLFHMVGFYDVTRHSSTDHTSFIDWDDFDDKIQPLCNNHDYRLDIENEVNLFDLFCSECVFHGYAPTLEYVDSVNQYLIRFRKIGPANETDAVRSGRTLTNGDIQQGQTQTDTHCDANLYNKMNVELNFIDGEAKGKINVNFPNGFQVNSNKSKTIKIVSSLSHISKLQNKNNSQTIGVYRHFEQLMRAFSIPNPQYRVKCTGSMGLEAAVNREFLLTDPLAFKPWTHEQGLSNTVAIMTGLNVDLGQRNMTTEVTARIDAELQYGYAPACSIHAGSSSKVGNNTIEATTSLHLYSRATDMVDCMNFDCYNYNLSTGQYVDRGCDCGDYAVFAMEGESTDPDLLEFDVTEVASDGSITLVDVGGGANYAAWDTAKGYILIFAAYDDCEDCQKKWLFFADSDNEIGTDSDPARRFV